MALILIVDDSPTEVHVMKKALESHGYRTAVAGDGEEGIRLGAPDAFPTSFSWISSCRASTATRPRARSSNDPEHARDPDCHGHLQGAGDRSHLGPAPGGPWITWSKPVSMDQLVEKAQAALARLTCPRALP